MSAYILTQTQLFYPNQLRGYFTKPFPKFFLDFLLLEDGESYREIP